MGQGRDALPRFCDGTHNKGRWIFDISTGLSYDMASPLTPSYSEAVSFFYDPAYIEEMKKYGGAGQELKKKGVKVMEIPYDKVATWGGGLRCSRHPLVRESVLPPAPTGTAAGATLY